jgi:TonB family protein
MKTLLGLFVWCAGLTIAASSFPDDMPQNISVRLHLASESTVYRQRTPQPIAQALPEYPLELRKQLVTGDATLRFTVTADGKKVTGLLVVKSSRKEFGQAAMSAVKGWTFAPGIDVDGKTRIPVQMEFLFVFEFHDVIAVQ